MVDVSSVVAERFAAFPRSEDDSDWDEVLLRAGVQRNRHRLGRRSLLVVGGVFVVGLLGAGIVGARLYRAEAAPGPTHVQRHVRNGTVHWIFEHEARGQSLAEAQVPVLATVGAHWQPVRFARVITFNTSPRAKVVLSLIGKRGRNLCITVLQGYSSSGGCAVGLLLKPFNYTSSSHMDPNCPTCGGVLVAGVASDDVQRIELFLPGGRQRPVALKDNVFVVALRPMESAVSLVAYDRAGLVIGRSSPPSRIHRLN
jgi:hypothetical protein